MIRLSVALVLLGTAVAGCGADEMRTPRLSSLPLVDGARVAAQEQVCDKGANPYCALDLVLIDPRYKSSNDLLSAERRELRKHGWTGANADTGDERAADSPGHKLRATYATAYGDLKGTGLGWIKRPQSIQLALSRTMFDRTAAISIMLEVGPS